MALITCPECGNQVSDKASSCPHCGNPMESAFEKSAPVPVAPINNDEDEFNRYMLLARRAKDENNSENAAKYYDMALRRNPLSWEASFFQVYFQAMDSRIIDISNAAISIANNVKNTIPLIAQIENEEEQRSALSTIATYSIAISLLLSNAAINHYNQHSTVDNAYNECSQRIVACYAIYTSLESATKKHCGADRIRLLCILEAANQFICSKGQFFNPDFRTRETGRLTYDIKQEQPSYEPPTMQTGGCYIATAVYGSYDCPEVWTLRRYRDFSLSRTWHGRTFIRTYYAISPTLVRFFGHTHWFKRIFKSKLDLLVADLQSRGFENTPYNDHDW